MTAPLTPAPLHFTLEFVRRDHSDDPSFFKLGTMEYSRRLPDKTYERSEFEWDDSLILDFEKLRQPGCEAEVLMKVGKRLRTFMNDFGWPEMASQIRAATDAKRRVIITIRSAASELYALPWELLTFKDTGAHLGRLDGVLLRYEWPGRPTRLQTAPSLEPGRIVIAHSAAGGTVPADAHIKAVRDACGAAAFMLFDARRDVIPNFSLRQLDEELQKSKDQNSPIAVLHILCHGGLMGTNYGLVIDGDEESLGKGWLDAGRLAQLLGDHADMVRLVVLMACDGSNQGKLGNELGSVAQAVHRAGIAAVVGSRFPLSKPGSIRLAKKLYECLIPKLTSLETALLEARRELFKETRTQDWASVQLYARSDDGDNTRPLVFRPYRGLLAFQSEHRPFFFGRDEEVNEVVGDLKALIDNKKARFLVIAGSSGTGKSSLVFAGAVPKLLEESPELIFLQMRTGSDPVEALDRTLATERPAEAPVLLVVDQFEELFTQTANPEVRTKFVKKLWALASDSQSGLRVIVTLRVDFIGRCGELIVDDAGLRLDVVAYDERHRIFIAQFKPAQLRAAIVEPAHKVGLTLQPGLAELMLKDVDNEPGALPLLEDTLDTLWQHREQGQLRLDTYNSLGGIVGALQKRANEILAKLTKENKGYLEIARRLLVSLVNVSDDTAFDTRRRVSVDELRQTIAADNPEGFERVLRELVAERLLVQDDDQKTPTVEVAHEALIRKWSTLRDWLGENRTKLVLQRQVRQAATHWGNSKRDPSLLFRGTQLARALELREAQTLRIGPLEKQFVDASEAEEKERQRREQESKQKSRDALLISIAQNRNQDPAIGAALLREVANTGSPLWAQAALNVLQNFIPELVFSKYSTDVAAFSPDGKRFAANRAIYKYQAYIWNPDGSKDFLRCRFPVKSIAFSLDGKKVATGTEGHNTLIWRAGEDVHGDNFLNDLSWHEGSVDSVAFSPDGNRIATGSSDSTARIGNVDGSGTPVVLSCPETRVNSVAFSPDGNRLATGSSDSAVRIWNPDGSLMYIHKARGDSSFQVVDILALAFSPDGNRIVSGSRDSGVYIWNVGSADEPVRLRGHSKAIRSVAFLNDRQVVSGSDDHTVRIWSAGGSGGYYDLKGHRSEISSVACSPDGTKIFTAALDGTAQIWNLSASSFKIPFSSEKDRVRSAAFSPDGNSIAMNAAGKSVQIRNLDRSGTPILFSGHDNHVNAIAFSPDGKKLATGSSDLTARIWNSDGSGTPVVIGGLKHPVVYVAFSPDGKELITVTDRQTLEVWNVDGSPTPVGFRHPEVASTGLTYSPCGKKLLIASTNAQIWSADGSGNPLELNEHRGMITAVAFSQDGAKVLTGSADYTARLWNVDGAGTPVVFQHKGVVLAAAFSPDGKKIVTSASDGIVRIWNLDDPGTPVMFTLNQETVRSLVFSPDGHSLALITDRESLYIVPISNEALLTKLWTITSFCVSETLRRELLLESPEDAKKGYERSVQALAEYRW